MASSNTGPNDTTTPTKAGGDRGKDTTLFPVGPAGRGELRKELKTTTNPAKTIAEFQASHSLHSMMAKAFNTTPLHQHKNTRNSGIAESLDTDSVMTFLSHLGVSQHEVHKRISDALLRQLEEEIRKTASEEPLLELLQTCWVYATTIQELQPVLSAVLKQLGPKTPRTVLLALSERDPQHGGTAEKATTTSTPQMKHAEIFRALPSSLKRLCWEADWDNRIPLSKAVMSDPQDFLEQQVHTTLLHATIRPFLTEYTTHPVLVDAANRPFVATVSERRILTTQRRALTQTATTATGAAATTAASSTTTNALTTGRAVAHLRHLLTDAGASYRPKLLYAVLSTLMAQHGSSSSGGGAEHLHCTLAADLLLSAGGPLPKAYADVLALARVLDDAVQEGNLSDANLVKLQTALKLIFQPEQQSDNTAAATTATPPKKAATAAEPDAPTTGIKRQLNRLISSGLTELKDADPHQLFLNPVTDAIAPNYSKIISRPMSISTMERKVAAHAYNSVTDWEMDVLLMFKNCVTYNQGSAGQWYRGEADRQSKLFRKEIYPHARRLYQNEIAKRSVLVNNDNDDNDNSGNIGGKRKAEGAGSSSSTASTMIAPLPPSSKKRKKEKEHQELPSMPALASMLLSDPFAVRLVRARILRELRRGVLLGATLPAAHAVVPSLLQVLHVARGSTHLCATRGRKFSVPSAGLDGGGDDDDDDRDGGDNNAGASTITDPTTLVSQATLRRYLPLLVRLLLEAELDRRAAPGGDLYQAMQQQGFPQTPSIPEDEWDGNDQMQVASALVEGALVHVCQPGNRNEASLATTFPKFATALQHLSVSLLDDRLFFLCLIQALVRHKTKLHRTTRDAVVQSWLQWLRRKPSMTSAAHECLVLLLNEWSSLGNVLLPRDALIRLAKQTVQAADESESSAERKFASLWKSSSSSSSDAAAAAAADKKSEFAPVKKQYERMLKHLPEATAKQWKEDVGLVVGSAEEEKTVAATAAEASENTATAMDVDADTAGGEEVGLLVERAEEEKAVEATAAEASEETATAMDVDADAAGGEQGAETTMKAS